MQDMQGRVVVVTGANSGIGYETAKALAFQQATVVMACRNLVAADEARERMMREAESQSIDLIKLDLASMDSVRSFVDAFVGRYSRLDVLVNNAGGFHAQRHMSEVGCELTFTENHLGPFLLTNLLLELMQQTPLSRIVNVSSNMHYSGSIDIDQIRGQGRYNGIKAYSASKLANVLFTLSLARRLDANNITANAVHPGLVSTNIWPDARWYHRIGRVFLRPMMINCAKGAENTLYAVLSDQLSGVSGQYLVKQKIVSATEVAYHEELQDQLWALSEQTVGWS